MSRAWRKICLIFLVWLSGCSREAEHDDAHARWAGAERADGGPQIDDSPEIATAPPKAADDSADGGAPVATTTGTSRFTQAGDERRTASACELEHEYREWLPTLTARPKRPPPRVARCDATRGCAKIVRHYVELASKNDFGCRCNATIYWPVLETRDGQRAPQALRALLEPASVAPETFAFEEMGGWLCGVDYVVHYDGFWVLDMSFRVSGIGAYPDTQLVHRTFDVERRRTLRAADVFVPERLGDLAASVDRRMQQAIRGKKGAPHEQFAVADLDDFIVSSRGITFFHLFELPHAARSANAMSEYPFSYAELAPFLRRDGMLTPIASQASLRR